MTDAQAMAAPRPAPRHMRPYDEWELAPAVSVIVPAYGVERYVEGAVRSLLGQTLDDIEVIVVDDGSPDATGEILDRLAAGDERLRVAHTENRGAPAARNVGLSLAKGKWVHFADADDEADPRMLELLVDAAESTDAELVIAGFEIATYVRDGVALPRSAQASLSSDSLGAFISERKSPRDARYRDAEAFRRSAHALFDDNMLYTPWNKLFLRSRIEGIGLRFDEGAFWDDFPFVLGYIRDVGRVTCISDVVYRFRRMRQESETSRWREGVWEKREEEHGWMLDLYGHWGLLGTPDVDELISRRYVERVMGCIENVCDPASGLTHRERQERIDKMMRWGRVQASLAVAQPRSRMMEAMLLPLRIGSVPLIEAEGIVISTVKKHFPERFALLKAAR